MGRWCHNWKESERAELRAAYFHLYGIERDDVEYILSTFSNTGLRPDDERRNQKFLWSPESTGQKILSKFDQFALSTYRTFRFIPLLFLLPSL